MSADSKLAKFVELFDETGLPYFAANVLSIKEKHRPTTVFEKTDNMCSFLSETLVIRPRATGTFSGDLTSRDDLILAALSLFLVLLIESILTTILLRTSSGTVNNTRFSIKQFVQLCREFRFHYAFRGHRREKGKRKSGINFPLLIASVFILFFSAGLQIFVLYLTTPMLVDVTNETVSLSHSQNENPSWDEIMQRGPMGTKRPCTALTLVSLYSQELEQGSTQISPCLVSSLPQETGSEARFETVTDPVNLTFASQVHDYGTEHSLTIGDRSVTFFSRVHYRLGDDKPRLMKTRGQLFVRDEEIVKHLHKQYVAYLFTAYQRETEDNSTINLQKLNKLKFKFSAKNGEDVNIVQINTRQRFVRVSSTVFTTTVEAVLPRGMPAFRMADMTLKASAAVTTAAPDTRDLIMGSANTFALTAVMWRETARTLNWATLLITCGVALFFLTIMRIFLKPTASAEIAAVWMSTAMLSAAQKHDGPEEVDTVELSMHTSFSADFGGLSSSFEEGVSSNFGEGAQSSYEEGISSGVGEEFISGSGGVASRRS
ncbi:unnamed protein product [Chondrus crispus]|uniref:Uncharacterized protein n=1 Tax=Chondrus crispus TaxID=2769 RepID=R7Q0L5_CHOCR|nr:unnamed protein product [Chondrus crispus]CDF32192.1 unnamed protein product [Chondrus crispus]|eukprot:XP_005711857.1 unnamed protein product [Chondrus crispus]